MRDIVYKDCIITHRDSKVLKSYIIDDKKEYHTGIDLEASEVYCPCCGVVIQACQVDDHQSVVVQYSGNISLRFTHLREVCVKPGELVDFNQVIGTADKYVHFEYLTSEQNTPSFRVYVAQGLALYKHDPRLVLDKNIIFDNYIAKMQYVEIFGETFDELSYNRGV